MNFIKVHNIFLFSFSIYAKCYFEGEPADGDYSKYKLKNCEVLEYENDIEHNKFYNREYQKSIEDDDGR